VKRFDLQSGSVTFLCDGCKVDVIRKGKQAGLLLVMQQGGSSYGQLWLVDSRGKKVRPLTGPNTSAEETLALATRLREGGKLPPTIEE